MNIRPKDLHVSKKWASSGDIEICLDGYLKIIIKMYWIFADFYKPLERRQKEADFEHLPLF